MPARRWRVQWRGPSARSINGGVTWVNDHSVHIRSFGNRDHAEAWLTVVRSTDGCTDAFLIDREGEANKYEALAREALDAGNIPAVIEYDSGRGVIWVHSMATGNTMIRVCGLRTPLPVGPIDMTVGATRMHLHHTGDHSTNVCSRERCGSDPHDTRDVTIWYGEALQDDESRNKQHSA